MMPIAITCDLRTRAIRLQFTNPDRFLTAEHALASGLITPLELKELQREVRALGMEVAQ
ncbi:hypothetical protein [Halomonas sp. Mc5H-6]|uniref:hypothetical protein n=1 Tax=Halomonas sp. Mc5H-6 TaxID=2954500 RepID=UPI002096C44C|nr:hypothetical protein [Halomonas sp. Mc5H-6]MCO7248065.1 hypothetical protein [Halomonas sp. Mc5H-6]